MTLRLVQDVTTVHTSSSGSFELVVLLPLGSHLAMLDVRSAHPSSVVVLDQFEVVPGGFPEYLGEQHALAISGTCNGLDSDVDIRVHLLLSSDPVEQNYGIHYVSGTSSGGGGGGLGGGSLGS